MNRYPYLKGILMNKELEASETLSYRMYQNISSPSKSWPLGQHKEVWSKFSASGRSAWSLRLSFQPSGWSGRCFLRLSLVSKEQVAAVGTALWKVKNFRWGTLATQEIELDSSLCNWFYFQILHPPLCSVSITLALVQFCIISCPNDWIIRLAYWSLPSHPILHIASEVSVL